MKKLTISIVTAVVLFIALAVLSASVVYVPEDKSVCVLRFNQVVNVYSEPGLVFITPFIESTTEIQKNARMYNLSPSDVLTLDKKAMTVSSYVVWKISNPKMFLQTAVNYNEAERRLDASVYNAVKNLLGSIEQTDAISSRGSELDANVLTKVRDAMKDYGVEIIDVQIKQFDLPQDNKEAVYTRMISERRKIAATYTAEGREEAEKIKNSADKEAAIIMSSAQAQAAQLRAEGESEYMRLLAEAYKGEDRAEFYEFIRSMDALKNSMTGDKVLFLPLESQLMRWFYGITE